MDGVVDGKIGCPVPGCGWGLQVEFSVHELSVRVSAMLGEFAEHLAVHHLPELTLTHAQISHLAPADYHPPWLYVVN